MANLPGIPHKDIEVPVKSYRDGLLKILRELRGRWQEENIVMEPFGPNLVNLVIKCRCGDQNKDAVMVRVNGEVIKMLPGHFDREYEYKIIRLLHQVSLGPPVVMTFRNGFCMDYVHGQHWDWSLDFYKDGPDADQFIRIVAREMASYHCQKTADIAREMGFDCQSQFKSYCQLVLDYAPHAVTDSLYGAEKIRAILGDNPYAVLEKEFQYVYGILDDLDLPVSFCHNDMNPTNFIYQPEKNRALLVDCEACCFNYTVYDLANHLFLTFVGPRANRSLPSDAYLKRWLRIYLDERCKLGYEINDMESEIERWAGHIEMMMLAVYLWQTSLALYWIQQKDHFDKPTLDMFLEIVLGETGARYWKEKERLAKPRD